MNYAIRSGIAITSKYATEQYSRLLDVSHSRLPPVLGPLLISLQNVKGTERSELAALQSRLESKIRVRITKSTRSLRSAGHLLMHVTI
jgi:hypothetical protein